MNNQTLYDEVVHNEFEIGEPQGVILRRSQRERFTIPNDYVVYL